MHILIIDDHQLFASGLELLLEGVSGDDIPIDVSIASTIKHVESLVQNKVYFDLILLDYHLPELSGEQLFEKIKRLMPSSDVIVISSDDSSDSVYKAMSLGAMGFIPKSSSKQVLISALKLILAGGTYFPAAAFDTVGSAHQESKLKLTKRQKTVLKLAADGLQNKQIAIELGISEGTVKAHLHKAFQELGVCNRTAAALMIQSIATQD